MLNENLIFSYKAVFITTQSLNEKLASISFDFSIIQTDFILALISAIFGFYLLFLLIVLKRTNFPEWVIRKIVHFSGGTFIAFIVTNFYSIFGIILAISFFAILFIVLILFSKFNLIKDLFILNNCRENESKYSFLINTIATLSILFIILMIFHNNLAVFTASTLIIAWADTSGEVFGKKYPLWKLKIFNQKTISGTFAVFIFSLISYITTFIYFQLDITVSSIWKIFIGCLLCTFIELFTWKWFDNILLPICSSIFMWWLTFSIK